jgi:hypothetical protein
MLCLVATLCWGTTGLFDKKSLLLDQAFKVYFARCAWDVLILARVYGNGLCPQTQIQLDG